MTCSFTRRTFEYLQQMHTIPSSAGCQPLPAHLLLLSAAGVHITSVEEALAVLAAGKHGKKGKKDKKHKKEKKGKKEKHAQHKHKHKS